MLAFDIIRDIMEFARKCSNESGFTLTSGMFTNASLFTRLRQEQLVSMGVTKFQVSFDGNVEMHDMYRVTRRETPTFNIIYRNLLAFHRSQLSGSVTLRFHVNKYNVESLRSLITKMSTDFKDDDRFSLFIRGLEKLGSAKDNLLPTVDDEEERDDLIGLLREYAQSLGLKLSGLPSSEIPVCYAASFSSYAIRATGEVSKCTVALYDKINIIGSISEDGKLKIDKEKLAYWVRGQFSGNRSELACPYAHDKIENNIASS